MRPVAAAQDEAFAVICYRGCRRHLPCSNHAARLKLAAGFKVWRPSAPIARGKAQILAIATRPSCPAEGASGPLLAISASHTTRPDRRPGSKAKENFPT
jgi:hypothetical protein